MRASCVATLGDLDGCDGVVYRRSGRGSACLDNANTVSSRRTARGSILIDASLNFFFHYSTSRDLMSAIQISNNKSWYQWDRQRTNGSLDIQSARQSIDIDRFRKMGEGGDKIKTYKNS